MKLIDKLRIYFYGFKTLKNEIKISENCLFENNRIASELIRNSHSIEKGLSIEKTRLGYGHKIQVEMMKRIMLLENSNSSYHKEAVYMALDSLRSYIKYHDENNFTDDVIEQIRKFIANFDLKNDNIYGGSILLKKENMVFNVKEIERFFNLRHSIREYDNSDVSDDKILKALKLAQRAPSACNRQGFRAYILSKNASRKMSHTLEGIGGFANSVNRFILITGKLSSYRANENRQFIVSASIFAAYLSLTLHLYGMGACVIQRPLIWNTEWNTLRNYLKIEKDEQLVLMIAVGNLKEKCEVPISHRVNDEVMFKFIKD